MHDATQRFKEASSRGQKPIIIYFGDYDPSGEDIPRALQENIKSLGCPEIELKRVALKEWQVIDWKLPPAPTKVTDSRSASWDGLGQVELDAVKPEVLISLLEHTVRDLFDENLHDELMRRESEEREYFRAELKRYVQEEL